MDKFQLIIELKMHWMDNVTSEFSLKWWPSRNVIFINLIRLKWPVVGSIVHRAVFDSNRNYPNNIWISINGMNDWNVLYWQQTETILFSNNGQLIHFARPPNQSTPHWHCYLVNWIAFHISNVSNYKFLLFYFITQTLNANVSK